MASLYVVTTGGTIEKAYSERTGSVANVIHKIERYLQLLRLPDCEVNVVPLLNKDSLGMTDEDRELITATVKGLLKEKAPIIITHGTDTLVETGLYLKRRLGAVRVPVIFTGAMAPLGFEGSDGLQNLTESICAARLLDAGIFVAMHGQVFAIDRVRKDHTRARFVAAEPS